MPCASSRETKPSTSLWYAAPPYRESTSLRPSQQSSLSGIRTAVMCQAASAAKDGSSAGPPQEPEHCTHMNAPPDGFAPRGRTVVAAASTRWVHDTCGVGAVVFPPPPPAV